MLKEARVRRGGRGNGIAIAQGRGDPEQFRLFRYRVHLVQRVTDCGKARQIRDHRAPAIYVVVPHYHAIGAGSERADLRREDERFRVYARGLIVVFGLA